MCFCFVVFLFVSFLLLLFCLFYSYLSIDEIKYKHLINVWKGCLKFFLDCVYCLIMNLYLHYFHYSIQFSIQLFNMKEMSPTGNNTVLDSSHCDIDLSIIFIFILQFWEWWLLQMKWYTYDLFLKIFFLREVPGI